VDKKKFVECVNAKMEKDLVEWAGTTVIKELGRRKKLIEKMSKEYLESPEGQKYLHRRVLETVRSYIDDVGDVFDYSFWDKLIRHAVTSSFKPEILKLVLKNKR